MLILVCLFIGEIIFEKILQERIGNNTKNRKYLQISFSFFFAVMIYIVFAGNDINLISASSDAADIWKTITTFHTDQIYGSYVLYKGINSVYPYVWLYDLSKLLGLNEWIFIRIFYCIAFAYVSSIGFPNMIELLVQRQTKLYQRCLCSALMWYLWAYSLAFTQLMIDLSCLMYFVLLINTALKIYRTKKSIIKYIWTGLLSGLCMTASGQYTMPAVCIDVFILWISFIDKKGWKSQVKMFIRNILPLLLCVMLIMCLNNYFETSFVNPLREEGAWIPAGETWLQAGLVRFRNNYRAGGFSSTIPSYRNAAILNDYYGESLANISEISVEEYLQIFLKYPVDFILNYLNSFFLILSPDHGGFNLLPLLTFYTLLYCSLYIGFTKCKSWKQFFSPLFLIGFSFLWATVPMLVMNIEPRTCMQIQGLIIALALCDNTIWDNIVDFIKHFKVNSLKRQNGISYPVVFYILFLCVCIMHIATLYETLGTDAKGILINLK